MSKVNQIEKELSSIDATKFHKLIDSYLNKKYYYKIDSIGTKPSEDKPTIGTPDTLISLENRKYIFAEHTTQKTGIKNKFLEDIDKCLDEDKTSIPREKIEKIIFTCNSKLNTKDIEELKKRCFDENIECDVLTLSVLSNDLFNHYPYLVQEYLHVKIDSKQILDVEDFITEYEHSKFAIPIGTKFHFREEEKKTIMKFFTNKNIILVSGDPGVGKTRLAIECANEFAKKNEYKFFCIYNRGADVLEDIQTYFSGEEKYLIFIDDVNRIHCALDYLISFFYAKIKCGKIKIILTIRNYAKKRTIEMLKSYSFDTDELEVKSFNNVEIDSFIVNEFDIIEREDREQIIKVCQGNPRLAAMMSKVFKDTNNFESIKDVSSIYEKYFASVQEDIFKEENEELLKVATIIAFYRVFDKENEEQVKVIENIFKITIVDFWKHVLKLHEYEIVDVYEKEVVRVADQVLSTYLFYEGVFKKNYLEIQIFLEQFLLTQSSRIDEVIIPIYSSFDRKLIEKSLQPAVNEVWKHAIDNSNEKLITEISSRFYFFKSTEIFLYMKEKFDNMVEENISIKEISFKRDMMDYYDESQYINILKKFSSSEKYYKIALDLILLYFSKKPSHAKYILSTLIENFGLADESSSQGYQIQIAVINKLIKKKKDSKLFLLLFYKVAENYLNLKYNHHHKVKVWNSFKKVEECSIKILRQKIWAEAFKQYDKEKAYVHSILNNYIAEHFRYRKSKVAPWDKECLTEFFLEKFNDKSYYDCKIVYDFISFFEKNDLEIHIDLSTRFKHEYLEVYKVFFQIKLELRQEYKNTNIEELEKIIAGNIYSYINGFSVKEYKKLFEAVIEINKYGIKEWYFTQNFCNIFSKLYEKESVLFEEILELFLVHYSDINMYCGRLIEFYYKRNGKKATLNFLNNLTCKDIDDLWFKYFYCLRSKDIDDSDIKRLLKHYETDDIKDLPSYLNLLDNYQNYDSTVLVNICKILEKRAIEDKKYIFPIQFLFQYAPKNRKNIIEIFKNDIELLERLYYLIDEHSEHHDKNAEAINMILDLDSDFLNKYLQYLFEKTDRLGREDGQRMYIKLWQRDDSSEIMASVVDYIFENRKKLRNMYVFSFLNRFFNRDQFGIDEEIELDNNQIKFLKNYIQIKNMEEVEFIFEQLICDLYVNLKIEMIITFLEKNKSLKDFKKLSFMPNSKSSSGSWVPILFEELEFYKSIKELLHEDINLLLHVKEMEQKISNVDKQICYEKKRDFISNH